MVNAISPANVLSFPLRFFGAKNWSVLGLTVRLLTGHVFYDMAKNKKCFSEACFGREQLSRRMTQEEAYKAIRYVTCANYIHAGKDHWIDGHLRKALLEDLEGFEKCENFYIDRKLGLKVTLLESEDNELLVTFGAHDSFNEFLPEAKKRAGIGQRVAIVANYAGLVPELYQKSLELVQKLKTDKKIVLVGQSLGGSIAQYVALKSDHSAVCINSVPLGAGLQWDIGDKEGDNVKHITVESDYVTDNKYIEPLDRIASHILGVRTPKNYGSRLTVPTAYSKGSETHCFAIGSIMKYLGHNERTKPSDVIQKN